LTNRSGRVVLLAVLAASCGAAGSFVLTTAVMDTIADSVLVGLACAAALVGVLAFQGASGLSELRKAPREALMLAAAGGALAFWAAPLLALAQRASDAPSGSESLFFTTSAWGLACVATAYSLRAERPPATALAGGIAAVAGAAGLLASWEYPSSFSPFAKFPVREALMLTAGLLFAAGALALAEAGRRFGPRLTVAAGLGGAAVLGLLGAVLQLPSASEIGQGALYPCIYLGLALAVFALGWTHATSAVGVSRTAASLLGVPVLVMALAGIERMTAVYGPNPIAWSGALAGAAVIAAGVAVVWLAEPATNVRLAGRSRSLRLPWGLALAASALAVASLFTPALDALAEGGTGEPFSASWAMIGAESAAGWLAFAAAGLALAAVMVARSGGSFRSWGSSSVAVMVCAVAAIPLLGTTLHTWNRWVPAEVQQTYGTEYSRLVVEPHLEPLRVMATLLAVAAVATLAFSMGRGKESGIVPKEDSR
jgi:drug/metabolite transporter (DMT)-like permease